MSLSQLLNQTVTLYPKASYDAYGREVMGTGVNYQARVQEVSKSRMLPTGQTVVIDAIVYIQSTPTVGVNDRLDYNSVQYKVHSYSVARDGQGNGNHTKLELMKWTQV